MPTLTEDGGEPVDPEGQTAPSRKEAGRTFAAGDPVGERYRIVRFIAEGGMGEVYEAEDNVLRDRIALKTIRGSAAGNEMAVERFRREILLARKVTHPNVCRIFDVGFHASAKVTFLTMELLAGQTLAERLRRQGRLTPAEALPLVEQMAAGLQAAHDAGVLHRDFKTSNVILTGERAVVTDFGLARTAGGSDRLTATGGIVGTPAYMAPEQVVGDALDERVDVYALGVVVYELVTGDLPFTSSSATGAAMKRLKERPPSPRERAPSLPRAWDAAILRCLEPEPKDRFRRPVDVVAALRSKAPRRRWPLVVAAAILLGVGGVTLAITHRTATAPQAPKRRAVAVLGFKNLSGKPESAWIGNAMGEMMSADLAASAAIRAVPGETVGRMRADLALVEADSYGPETLARIRSAIGADVVVIGSYVAASGKIDVVLRVQDVASGDTLATAKQSGSESELLDLVGRTAASVREPLGVAGLSGAAAVALHAALPKNAEAARLYAEGLAALHLFDARTARDRLTRAAAIEPDNPMIHLALADGWALLFGSEAEARKEAQRAWELSDGLGRDDKLLVEARHRVATYEYEKAIAIYRQLLEWYPDNLEVGFKLIDAQMMAGDESGSARTMQHLRTLGNDPRFEYYAGMAAYSSGDFAGARAAFDRGLAVAASLGGRTLRAQILQARAQLATDEGDLAGARADAEQALQIFVETGNHDGSRLPHATLSFVSLEKADVAKALEWGERLATLGREGGNSMGEAAGDLATAFALLQADRLAESHTRALHGLELFRRVCLHHCTVMAEFALAMVTYEEGKPGEAEAHARTAIATARERHVAWLEALGHLALAQALLGQGRRAESVAPMKEAMPIFRLFPAASIFPYFAELTDAVITGEADAMELDASIRRLGELAARFETIGFVTRMLEARLHQGRFMLRGGRAKEGEALLASVERDARQRGLLLIARKARAR